jgi:ATP-binding cassette subfamily C protein CydC
VLGLMPRAGASLAAAAAAARRLFDAADTPEPVPDPANPAALPKSHALRLSGVVFAWAPDRAPVFDGLDFDVPEGARIALLGPSGTGKSTLAALLLKFAAPQAGRITLGGTDIATLAARRPAPARRLADAGCPAVRRQHRRQPPPRRA